jgi:hypothetical protein
VALLAGFTIAVLAAVVLAPGIPQPQSYPDFAAQRALLGIPNFGDLASNLLFAARGAWGLVFLFRPRGPERFIDPRERGAYVFVFLGLFTLGRHSISGHTPKHLAAGAAGLRILRMLETPRQAP